MLDSSRLKVKAVYIGDTMATYMIGTKHGYNNLLKTDTVLYIVVREQLLLSRDLLIEDPNRVVV